MSRRESKIIQIIPAVGWHAVFEKKDATNMSFTSHEKPLVCWALIEWGVTSQDVVGLVADAKRGAAIPAPEIENFARYEFKGTR